MLISNWRLWSSHKCREFAESIGESDKWDGVWRRNSIPTTFRMPPPCVPFDAESPGSLSDPTVTLFSDVANNQSISRRKTTCLTLFGTRSRPYWAEIFLLLLIFFLMQCSTGAAMDGCELREERARREEVFDLYFTLFLLLFRTEEIRGW